MTFFRPRRGLHDHRYTGVSVMEAFDPSHALALFNGVVAAFLPLSVGVAGPASLQLENDCMVCHRIFLGSQLGLCVQ